MPLNPFSKKENRTKHKSSSKSTSTSSTRRDDCKALCCKKKFAKIATGILSTGLVASQCEINRINNNVLIVEPKFEAILTTVMQSTAATSEPFPGCSGDGAIESVAVAAMQNAVWSDLLTWKTVDPCLTNYLFAYEFQYGDYLNGLWGNFNVLNNDLLQIKYQVSGINGINQGANAITLNDLVNYTSVESPLYSTQIVSNAKNIECMLAQIFPQIAVTPNSESSNFKPVISNASYVDKLDNNKVKNARVAVWREPCTEEVPVTCNDGKYYLIGFSSKACRKPCSPCK